MREVDCQNVNSDPWERSPFPNTLDFWNGGYDRLEARTESTLCPAECSVLRYDPGLPIEQTSNLTGPDIGALSLGWDNW